MAITKRDLEEVIERVKGARRRADMTQAQVAEALGVGTSTYNSYETMARDLSIEDLLRLPAILQCKITDLLPASVVWPVDRARAIDFRLQAIIDRWDDLSDRGRRHLQEALEVALELSPRH